MRHTFPNDKSGVNYCTSGTLVKDWFSLTVLPIGKYSPNLLQIHSDKADLSYSKS